MRPFRLARIAAEAESVRLHGMISRIVMRAVLAFVALLFLLGAMVFVHIAAWYEIRISLNQSYLATAGILGGADLVLAVVIGLLAARSSPSRVEIEALEVRRKAIEGLGSALTLGQMALPLLRLLAGFGRRKRA
jgi:hypothetical protein